MVFVQTKKQAHRLHILLGLLGIKVSMFQYYVENYFLQRKKKKKNSDLKTYFWYLIRLESFMAILRNLKD